MDSGIFQTTKSLVKDRVDELSEKGAKELNELC